MVRRSHVTYLNNSCHNYEPATSHVRISPRYARCVQVHDSIYARHDSFTCHTCASFICETWVTMANNCSGIHYGTAFWGIFWVRKETRLIHFSHVPHSYVRHELHLQVVPAQFVTQQLSEAYSRCVKKHDIFICETWVTTTSSSGAIHHTTAFWGIF